MADVKELKRLIYEDERIEEVLELLGCKDIKHEQGGLLITASLPTGNNKRSVQVKNNIHLNTSVRSRGVKGDICTLVSYIVNECSNEDEFDNDLPNAKEWLIDNLGYHAVLSKKGKREERKEYNSWLKDIKKKRRKRVDLGGIKPNTVLPETVVNYYRMKPFQEWIDEGIDYETQEEWEVGFCFDSHRIVVMIRNMNGELIGVKGRTLDKMYKEKDIPKYIYLQKMNKSIEIFGLHKTSPYIADKREIILFEGFKSVFKSWQYGYRNCGSIEGDDVQPVQVSIAKSFGIDTSIVLCYDKDKTPKEIIEQAKKFTNRKVYIVYDNDDLLGEIVDEEGNENKNAPVDCGFDIWEKLYYNKYELGRFIELFGKKKESDEELD
jgi:DNA primase